MPRAASSSRPGGSQTTTTTTKLAHHPSPPTAGGRTRAVPCSPGLSNNNSNSQSRAVLASSRGRTAAPTKTTTTNGRAVKHTRLSPSSSVASSKRAASVGTGAAPAPNAVLTSTAAVSVPAYLMGAGQGSQLTNGFQPNASARMTHSSTTRMAMSGGGSGAVAAQLGQSQPSLGLSRGAWNPDGSLGRTGTKPSDVMAATNATGAPPAGAESPSITYKVGKAVLNPYVAVAPAVQHGVRGVQPSDELPDTARRPLTGALLAPLQTEMLLPATPGGGPDELGPNRSGDATGYSPTDAERITTFDRLSPDTQADIMSPVSMPVFTSTMLQHRTSVSAAAVMASPAGALAAAAAMSGARPSYEVTPSYTGRTTTTAQTSSQLRARRAVPDTVKLSTDLLWLKDSLHPAQELMAGPAFSAAIAVTAAQRVDDHGVPLLCAEEVVVDGAAASASSSSAAGQSGKRGSEGRGMGVLRGLYGTTARDTTAIRSLRACVAGETATTAVDVLPVLMRADAKTKELVAARRLVDWNAAIPTADTVAPPVIAFLDRKGNPLPHRPRADLTLNCATFELTEATTPASGSNSGALGSTDACLLGSQFKYEPSGRECDGGAAAIGEHRLCGLVGLVTGLAERIGMERVMEYQVRTANTDMLLAPPRMVGSDLVLRVNPSLQGTILLHVVGFDCAHVNASTGAILESTNQLTCAIHVLYKGTQDGTAESTALATANNNNNNTGTAQSVVSLGRSGETLEERELARLKAHRQSIDGNTAPSPDERLGVTAAKPTTSNSNADNSDGARFAFPVSNPYELRYSSMRETVRAILTQAYTTQLTERAEAGKTQRQLQLQQQQQQNGSGLDSLHSSVCKSNEDGNLKSPRGDDASCPSGEPSAQDGALEVSFDPLAGPVAVFGAADPTAGGHDKGSPTTVAPATRHSASTANGSGSGSGSGTGAGGASQSRATRRRVTLLFTERPKVTAASRAAAPSATPIRTPDTVLSSDATSVTPAEMHEEQELRHINEAAYTFIAPSGCLQTHCYNLRIAAWQDHTTSLFGERDRDLFDSEARTAFKRHVRQELSDAVLSSLSGGRSAGASAVLGRSAASATIDPSGVSAAAGGGSGARRGLLSAADGAAATAQSTSEQSLALLRRLLLCLMSEDVRSSVQLYNDTLSVAAHFTHNALIRSTSCTGGTPETLQKLSASALASAEPSRLSDKDRRNLALLVDALNVAMCAMFQVGCFKKAIAYGVQRVHALCVLEGTMNAVVAAAQRDMAELYLIFGDYALAVRTGEEVLMVAEQLFDLNSNEVCGAESLLFLACHEGGFHRRKEELRLRLVDALDRLTTSSTAGLTSAAINNRRTLIAEIHLVLCVALPPLTFSSFAAAAADKASGEIQVALDHLYEAVVLLRGDGDLADIDKSFSTFAAVASAMGSGADPFFRGEDGRQKRRRWSFLGLAAGMLMRLGEYTRGMAVLEALVEELVLGKHRYVERIHRAEIGALSWANIALWRYNHQPLERDDNLILLRRMVHRLTTVMGPLHPLSAMGNLVLSYVRRSSLAQTSTVAKLAIKSLSVMRSQLASRSQLVQTGYRICNATCVADEGRWLDIVDHANSALLIAQVNHARDEWMVVVEKEFLAALLLCPATAVVRLNNELLRGRLEDRLDRMSGTYGAQSEVLITPVCNLANACYLLGDLEQALDYTQRAVRLADPKGILFVSAAVLKPAAVLASSAEVTRRDQLVHSVMESTWRVVRLGELLFALAAVLEASGNAADAQDCYARSLALYESVKLQSSLPAARVQAALAKLLYSSGEYGDALGWAIACERTVHERYGMWKSEAHKSRTLVRAIEEQLAAKEGAYIMVNTNNTNLDYLELI